MEKVTQTSTRKSDHIRINLEEDVRSNLTTGLEHYRFDHQALPELDLEEIDLTLELFGKRLRSPLLISSMTGGTAQAGEINRILASAAQEAGIAIGVGSQRAAIEQPELASTFQIRRYAPDVLLFANLGAVQLNYGYGVDECRQAVDMIQADGLFLHFNALQEAVQPEGDTCFSGLLGKVEKVCKALSVPVMAKEVGWGFSELMAIKLKQVGIAGIDVAGAGGTSWTQVEKHRAKDENQARLAASFVGWGIPTSESIINVQRAAPGLKIFASGGLRSGIDVAKCIALGATLGGMASPFLKAAAQSLEAVIGTINAINREIQICMFAAGVKDLQQLASAHLIKLE